MSIPRERFGVSALMSRFGERVLGRASRLFRAGNVTKQGWEEDGVHYLVTVLDDAEHPVRVDLAGADLATECTCGVAACAHQAAALLDLGRSPEVFEAVPRLAERVPWQVVLRRGMETDLPPPPPDGAGAWLVYRLDIQDNGDVVVETHKVQPSGRGAEKHSPFSLARTWGADPLEPAPDFMSRYDMAMCRQLRQFPVEARRLGQRQAASYRFTPPLEARYGLLTRLAQGGRLYLADAPQPLVVGAPQVVVPILEKTDDDGWCLRLPLGGDGPAPSGVRVIAGEPPLYCDGQVIGGLIVPLPGRLAAQLAEQPLLVPPSDRAEFATHWLPRLVAMGDLALPPELTPHTVTGTPPVPRLTLTDTRSELLLGMEFVYGAAPPVATVGITRPLAEQDGRVVLYARDREREKALTERLLAPRTPDLSAPLPKSPGSWALAGDDALDFLLEELPRLAAEGWQVFGEASLAEHRVYRGQARMASRVVSGVDWFDLEVGADFDGTVVGADELLKAWEAGRRYIPLLDGRVARIPTWVREQAGALHEAELGAGGQARLTRYQVPLVMELTGGDGADAAFREVVERIRSFSGVGSVAPPEGLKATLRPYQAEGLAWLDFLREYGFHGILADDMGLGKTIQVIALLLLEKSRGNLTSPSLVVVPTSLIFNWTHEIERMAPGLTVAVWHGSDRHASPERLREADVVLTNYALVRQDLARLEAIPFHYLVLDESQYVKNPESQVSRAVRELKATHRLALTGTPLENHLGELWAQFAFLMPGLLGSYRHFRRRFGGPVERGDGDAAQALLTRVRPFVLRRTKEQVAAELPERVESTLYCRLEDGQRVLYDRIRDLCRAQVANSIKTRGLGRSRVTILDALLKLRQVCCHPELLPAALRGDVGESAKMTLFMEFVTEAVEEEHRVLVFSQFVSMLTIIRKRLDTAGVPYSYLDGRTRDRERRVTEFQDNPRIPLFLISLKAGGTGLNLTGADYVVHFDPWWNPAVEQQATDRAHRIGQTRKVFSYKLIAEDTVEEKIVAMQERKRALSNILLGGEKDLVTDLELKDLELIFGTLDL
ncbi:MAG: SNF2 helicase associated domain-containing protein [Nitrospirae bacterium]|nr:SNF2 helicase associated domain-containing protein [Nitrospirota bacterium]